MTRSNYSLLAFFLCVFIFHSCSTDDSIQCNGVPSFTFATVEGGTFLMGTTNNPDFLFQEHEVTVYDFEIMTTEVTQDMWETVMGSNPSEKVGPNLPVTNISWYDVEIFISTLNECNGSNFRLPTEAEWEFAARGGLLTEGLNYSGGDELNDVAWYGAWIDEEGNCSEIQEVALKNANELGLFDMSGNASEWVQDIFQDRYENDRTLNPLGPGTGTFRVRKGGSWGNDSPSCAPEARFANIPALASGYIGFRLVR